MSGMQASAAATFEGRPVVPPAGVGVAAGGVVGSTDFGMLHLEERQAGLSRELHFLFRADETARTLGRCESGDCPNSDAAL